MGDIIYLQYANRLKSGTADKILIESNQIYNEPLALTTDPDSKIELFPGDGIVPDCISGLPLGGELVGAFGIELENLSSNCSLSSDTVKRRQDWVNYVLTSSLKIINTRLSSDIQLCSNALSSKLDTQEFLSTQIPTYRIQEKINIFDGPGNLAPSFVTSSCVTLLSSSLTQLASSILTSDINLGSGLYVGSFEDIFKTSQTWINYVLTTSILDVKTQLSSDIQLCSSILSSQINTTKSELSSRISSAETELSSQLSSAVSVLSSQINTTKSELTVDINDLDKIKSGASYYDIFDQYIYHFRSEGDKMKWLIEKDDSLILNKYSIGVGFQAEPDASSISIENHNGEMITMIPAANYSNAGVMTAEDKIKLSQLCESITDKQEKMKIEYKTITDYNVNYTINKNSILKVENDVTGILKVSFGLPDRTDFGGFAQYGLYFSTGSSAPSLQLPSNVKWANENAIAIDTNSTYEVIFTTHDNGATYTAIWTRYSHIANSTSYKPYFTMDCTNSGGVLISRKNGSPAPSNEESFFYSVSDDNGVTWSNWTQIGIGVALQLISGKKYRWKCNAHLNFQSGYTNNSASGHRSTYNVEGHSYTGNGLHYNFHFFTKDGSTPKVNLSGNILSLMFGDDFIGKEDETLPSGAFQKMFKPYTLTNYPNTNASSIIEAKDLILPSKTLPTGAYHQIFNGCTELKSTPKILAENAIGDYCCAEMFANCTGLLEAHELKITNFGTSIYACSGMFFGCNKLTKAVIPPATKIACGTYYIMYTNCTELIEVPDIPATEISKFENVECNVSLMRMFEGCTKLEKINGSLKIKIPGGGCYNRMFNGCTLLKVAPEILATQSAYRFCNQMFKGCTNLVVPPPYLPKSVTASSQEAYYEMFCNCTGLEYGPTLLAEVPVTKMYNRMFNGCTSLKNIPYIGLHRVVSVAAGECCDYMFNGCSALKHAELTKNIKYVPDYTVQSRGWMNRIFAGTDNLKSIRICYDLIGVNAKNTYDALHSAFGFDINKASSVRWYTRAQNNSAGQGGILYIPKSLADKIKSLQSTEYTGQNRWKEFCDYMVPSNWEVVAE